MIELISLIAKSLVKQPDAVSVTMVQKGNVEVYELHVAPEDMGKVIGKPVQFDSGNTRMLSPLCTRAL